MKPLAVHETAAAVLYWGIVSAWLAAELAYMRRTGADQVEEPDRSRSLLTVSVLASLALAAVVAHRVESLTPPGAGWWPLVVGLAIMACALALGNWLSPVIVGGTALVANTLRLRSEERELSASIGAPYEEYMLRTRRLIPGIW